MHVLRIKQSPSKASTKEALFSPTSQIPPTLVSSNDVRFLVANVMNSGMRQVLMSVKGPVKALNLPALSLVMLAQPFVKRLRAFSVCASVLQTSSSLDRIEDRTNCSLDKPVKLGLGMSGEVICRHTIF